MLRPVFMFAAVMALTSGAAPAEATVEDDLRACAALDYAPARLVCYDQVVFGIGIEGAVTLRDTRRSLEAILANIEEMEKECGPDETPAACEARNDADARIDAAVEDVAKERLNEPDEGSGQIATARDGN